MGEQLGHVVKHPCDVPADIQYHRLLLGTYVRQHLEGTLQMVYARSVIGVWISCTCMLTDALVIDKPIITCGRGRGRGRGWAWYVG